ncbi:MAG: ptrB [Glaciihabitans sp.]|nr:ptrB [Glaciihabitans sp.]
MRLQPPVASRQPVLRTHHGDTVTDNYEWMRNKSDPVVIAHLEAENAYTDQETADLEVLTEQIFEEITAHTLETDLSVPVREGGWWYYSRTVEGRQYGIRCRVPAAGTDDWVPPVVDRDLVAGISTDGMHEQVLLDSNAEAEGHDFFSLGGFDVSGDGRRLLYAVDVVGDERYTLRIRDLDTGSDLPDVIENISGAAVFDATGGFIFYTTVDDAWRPDTVWRHRVGTSSAEDVEVFTEPDERYWVGVGLTRSRRFLVIDAGSKITSESWILDTADPEGEFRVVWPRKQGVEYSVEHAVIDGDDRILIVHNDGALDFELVDVAAADPAGDRRRLVPHSPGTRLEAVEAFATFLALEYRREALPRLAVATLDGSPIAFTELQFTEELFSVGISANPEWNQPSLRFGYTSFVTPSTVNSYDVGSGVITQLKQQPVLGFTPSLYTQRREWATAADGTRVPISLYYRADLLVAGEPSPLVLYGYGSYETSIDPSFSIPRLSLLNRGVVQAVAHVRGGGELGRDWYERGKMLTKPNSFSDFVDCARFLTESGLTSPGQLVAQGGSAGGLLMGAVANLAPELFAGILAVVPFVDPLTSILDPSLPLTVVEWDEWGDPLHDPEIYALMKSYSPYENVREARYPQILAETSLNDTRVLYVEPAKWVARLREVGAPVLLRTEMSAGHGGVSGRYESWRKTAFDYAWVLRALAQSSS